MIPVLRRARQAAEFEPQDQAHMVHSDLGEQTLKAGSLLDGSAASTLILVNHQDPFLGPTERASIIGQGILTLARFLVVKDLLSAGLANVDDRQFAEVPITEGSGAAAKCSRRAARQRSGSRRTARVVRLAHASPPAGWETA